MRNRKPFDLRKLMGIWNLGLAIFSFLGAFYTLPELVNTITTDSFLSSVCDPNCFNKPVAKWIFWFNVSKIFEFGDTIFIVLRKKPLIFLHYYHHIATMLYCWYANQVSCLWNCTGWWFATVNLIVHTIMYTYYGLASYGIYLPGSFIITAVQIIQMVIGMFIIIYARLSCPFAEGYQFGFIISFMMYLSYFILFARFFVNRYLNSQKKKKQQ